MRAPACLAIEGGPISVNQAVIRFGSAALPSYTLLDPTAYVVTHVAEDESYCLVAMSPDYFRERTNWRVVRDGTRAKLMYLCPDDGELLDHVHEHWAEDGTHKRRASKT